jgi:transcriptional regulator with XRE-family HTH domain
MRAPAGRAAGARLEKRHQRDLYISRLLDTPRTRPASCSTMPAPARPHLFSAALASVMQDRGVNQVQLSQRTGIAVSRLNNYLKGNYRTVTPAHAAAIFEALGGTPMDNAVLIQAYLFDLLPDGCRGLVEIRVPGVREAAGKWEVPSKGLPGEFAAAFRALYVLCVSNVKVRQRTAEWVEMMRETKG